METKRTQEEIDRVYDWATEAVEHSTSHFPGMTYEEGIRAVLAWLEGNTDVAPDAE